MTLEPGEGLKEAKLVERWEAQLEAQLEAGKDLKEAKLVVAEKAPEVEARKNSAAEMRPLMAEEGLKSEECLT